MSRTGIENVRSNSLRAGRTNRTRISFRRGLERTRGGIGVDGRLRHRGWWSLLRVWKFEGCVGDLYSSFILACCRAESSLGALRRDSTVSKGSPKRPHTLPERCIRRAPAADLRICVHRKKLSGWVQGQWPCFSRQVSVWWDMFRMMVGRLSQQQWQETPTFQVEIDVSSSCMSWHVSDSSRE